MASAPVLTNKEKQVLASQREIEWLRRQIDQYKSALAPAPTESNDDAEQDLCNTIDRLRAELDVMTQFNLSRKCMTRNLDASYHTLNTLYAGPSDHDSMERRYGYRSNVDMDTQPTHRRLVTEKLEERDELTVVILRIVDQLKKARVQLAKTQAKVMGKPSAISWSPLMIDSCALDSHLTNRHLTESIQRTRERQLEEIAKEPSHVSVRPEV